MPPMCRPPTAEPLLSLPVPQVRRAEQALWDETGLLPAPQAVADRCGLTHSKLMALYKSFRAPTSRDGVPTLGAGSVDAKAPGEQWVEEVGEEVSRGRRSPLLLPVPGCPLLPIPLPPGIPDPPGIPPPPHPACSALPAHPLRRTPLSWRTTA